MRAGIRNKIKQNKQEIYLGNIPISILRDKGTISNTFNGSWILKECFRISKLHKLNHHFTLKLSQRSQFSSYLALWLEDLRDFSGTEAPWCRAPSFAKAEVSAAPCCAVLGSAEPQAEIIRDVSQPIHQAF